MRKRTAYLAAAVAAVVLVPTALVSAHMRYRNHHTRYRNHWTITHHIPRYSSLLGAHVVGSSRARIASSPPGSNNGSYCTTPVVDALYTFTSSPGPASGSIKTSVSNEFVVAFVGSTGPSAGGQSVTVSGGGLSWHKVAAKNTAGGDAEVWWAIAGSKGTYTGITAKQAKTPYAETLMLFTYKSASAIGASGTFTSPMGAPTGTITPTHQCSWVWAVGNDPAAAVKRTPGAFQNVWTTTTVSGNGYGAPSTFWVQSTNFPNTSPRPMTINDTAPAKDPYNLVLAEIY
jgi:hypothetical protein